MKKNAVAKGQYGYLNSRKKISIFRCLLCCALTLLLVLCGRVFFRQHGGLFVILAIISAVPAAMSAVTMTMFLRFQTGRREVFDEVEKVKENAQVFYDSVITTREKSYPVNCFAAFNKNLLVLSEYEGVDEAPLIHHLENMAKKNGFKDWNIKLFRDLSKFTTRLAYLEEKNMKTLKQDVEMIELVRSLSL
ncbi:MAG: hypothetical protein K5989_03410 [Lachnospiraceae bacterium]|nr:hypothetical protein [Lachnospiraceae bacterium]